MPFIGKQPQAGAYSKLDAITTSATATYNLTLDSGAYYPQSANHLLVSLNGVIQAPQDSFTVSGSQITFDSALTSADVIDFIIALGDTLDIGVPSAGSVNTSQLANDAVTTAKIAAGAVDTTELASNAVTTAKIADDAITGAKIENNPTIAGNLAVTGTSVLTGNVGIGTSASTGNNPLVVQAGSGAGGINLHGRSSDNTATMLIGKSSDGNTAYNTITSYANRMRIQSGFSSDTNTMEFFTNDVSRVVIDASGKIVASAGVAIGGTGAANTLDDYEEGTWTPALSSQAGTHSLNQVAGRYQKIGDFCTARFWINHNSFNGNGSYGIQLTGLPFTAGTQIVAVRDIGQIFGAGFEGIPILNSNYNLLGGYITQSATTATFRMSGGGQSERSLDGSISTGGGYLYGEVRYSTA